MTTRAAKVLFTLEDLKINVCEAIDYTKGTLLPSKRFVIERFCTLRQLKQNDMGKFKGLRNEVITELAHELQEAWIFMNVYPVSIKMIKIKVEKFIVEVEKLKETAVVKRKETWTNKFKDFKLKIENGFDIKTKDVVNQKLYEKDYDVKMTEIDEKFYLDNCQELMTDLKLVDGSQRLAGQCKRIELCVNVDGPWLKAAVKRRERKKREGLAQSASVEKIKTEQSRNEIVDIDEGLAAAGLALPEADGQDEEISPTVKFPFLSPSSIKSSPAVTRSNPDPIEQEENTVFPKIKTRNSYNTMNVEVMEVIVELVSKFQMPESRVCEALQLVLNKLCCPGLPLLLGR